MTPTAKLRFVTRQVEFDTGQITIPDGKKVIGKRPYTILQQWWAVERDGQITPTGEWRDVPLEVEQ